MFFVAFGGKKFPKSSPRFPLAFSPHFEQVRNTKGRPLIGSALSLNISTVSFALAAVSLAVFSAFGWYLSGGVLCFCCDPLGGNLSILYHVKPDFPGL